MKTQSLSLQVSPGIGTVSAEYTIAEKSNCIITLAHGAGAGMNHVFMITLAKSLAELNISTLRFNFPFVENKKGRPDVPAVAHQTIEAAIRHAHELFPALPLFVAGKSFGGRMSSQHLAIHHHAIVKGLIFYGFPLHPPKKPAVERAEHLKEVQVPLLFLQGSRDELATWELIESVCSTLRNASLIKIEGADHAFKAGKRDVISELSNHTKSWIDTIL